MLQLLSHPEAAIRTGAAVGEWLYAPKHAIRPDLIGTWRTAIVQADPKQDGVFNDLFATHPDVAQTWAARRITEATGFDLWNYRHTINSVASTLDADGRLTLLLQMDNETRYDSCWFDALVGDDINLFVQWLERQTDVTLRVLPLRRRPSARWVERVVVALRHGVTVDEIAAQIGGWDEEWSGSEAEHFGRYSTQYEDLAAKGDAWMRRIAMHGIDWAKRRVASARSRDDTDETD